MPSSDIPEGCVLVGPRNSRFFIFSDQLLAILHAMYLVSNKVASNEAKITVFLHISYNYLCTCHPSSPKCCPCQFCLAWKMKNVKYLQNRSERVSNSTRNLSYLTYFFQFSCSAECRQSLLCLLQ